MARHLIQNAATGDTRIVGDAALPFFPGYVIRDTLEDGIPEAVFYGAGESDLRYVNVSELSNPESAASVALRAALVPFWKANESVDAGTVRMTALGVTIKRIASGSTRPSYDATEAAQWKVVSGPAADLDDVGYDIIIGAGQSNLVGNGTGSTNALVDLTDPRVWVYAPGGVNANTIVQAADPLVHLSGAAAPVGPMMEFARWYADTIPGRRVLLVPSAYNGTGLLDGSPRWDPTTSWPNDGNNLYNRTIALALAAKAAAGPNARFAGLLWAQGENEVLGAASGTAYRTALEYLIDGVRSRLSAPTLPVVIGSMVPEFIASQAGAPAIVAVHEATPTRKPYTAYVAGPSGMAVDSGGVTAVHYSTAGARELGRRMVAGLAAARSNGSPANAVAANPPTPPPTAITNTVPPAITGTLTTGQTLTVSNGTWSPTPDSYSYQWRRGASAISGATSATYVLVQADEGQVISCTVTAVKSGLPNGTATSNTVTPSALPAPTVTDDFNRANATSLGSTSSGTAWTTSAGGWGVTGNQAYNAAAPTVSTSVVSVGATDHYAQTQLAVIGALLLLTRFVDTSNFYCLFVNTSGVLTLYKSVAGTLTQIGSGLGTAVAGDVVALKVVGSTLTAYKNGVAVGTATDGTHTSGTKVGINSDSTTVRLDNFAAAPIAP